MYGHYSAQVLPWLAPAPRVRDDEAAGHQGAEPGEEVEADGKVRGGVGCDNDIRSLAMYNLRGLGMMISPQVDA